MTLALVYRNGEEAFFIHDFRVSYPGGIKVDAMMKFAAFDDRIGLFFAGDVKTFRRLIPHIRSVARSITVDNVLQSKGPLADTIESYMMGNMDNLPTDRRLEILGFIIDGDKKRHECFHINARVGYGSRLEAVPDKTAVVIGSAHELCGLAPNLARKVSQVLNNGYDVCTALGVAKAHLKETFCLAGPNSYAELGISPIFVGSVLKQSQFQMIGARLIGKRLTTDFGPCGSSSPIQYDYTFHRTDGILELVDNLTGVKIVVEEAENFQVRPCTEILDPENLTKSFDPTLFADPTGIIYVINQWVHNPQLIIRTVYKTRLIGSICDPCYTRLACDEITVTNPAEFLRYIRSGNHGIFIRQGCEFAFEQGLRHHLFDHKWLAQHVSNYSELYI